MSLPGRPRTCSHPVCGRCEGTVGQRESIGYKKSAHPSSCVMSMNVTLVEEKPTNNNNPFERGHFHTWLESPPQVSGMSQSLTAWRHVTPLSSYCHGNGQTRGTLDGDFTTTKTELTLQSLQQRPLLHMALWVRVHFLQQFAPSRAHSYETPEATLACIDHDKSAGSRGGGAGSYHERAAVALLAQLHVSVAALGWVQQLQRSVAVLVPSQLLFRSTRWRQRWV